MVILFLYSNCLLFVLQNKTDIVQIMGSNKNLVSRLEDVYDQAIGQLERRVDKLQGMFISYY